MKSNQQFFFALFTGALLFLAVSLGAQGRHGKPHHPQPFFGLGQFQSELQLTEAQMAQMDELKASFETERAALEKQEFETPEARHDAFRKLRTEHKAAVEKILTEEQKARLQQMRQERPAGPRHAIGKEEKAALRSELKTYRTENIMPVLRAQRAKLEEKLSPEDKAQIAALRTAFAAMRQEKRALKQDENKSREDFRRLRESNQENFDALKALADKYEADIEGLMADIQPQQEKWSQDIRAIIQNYRPEPGPGQKEQGREWKRGPKGPREALPGKPEMHKGRFLLLDPDAANKPADAPLFRKVKVFPNPASKEVTLQYTLEKAGDVRIELRNKEGNLLKVVKEGAEPAGPQSVVIDAGQLQEGVYYLAVISKGQQLTQKVVISKR